MRPTPRAAPGGRSSARSISSSASSESLKPSGPKNLMPLSANGLCDALSTAARSKPYACSSSGAAGVGSTPPSSASPPAAATPAATADSSISPDSRVSRMTRTRGRAVPRSRSPWVAARARARASSAVRNSPATPRTPSVPNSLRATRARLPLAELRALARLLQAGLLAFLRPGVAGEEASALELAAQVGIGLEQRARDAVAQRAGLGGHAAAVHAGDDVHAVLVADGLERLADRALEGGAWEVRVEGLAVDRVRAVARLEGHSGDRRLALAGGAVGRAGGEVDGGLGDRLVGELVLLVDGLGRRLVEVLFVGRALLVTV